MMTLYTLSCPCASKGCLVNLIAPALVVEETNGRAPIQDFCVSIGTSPRCT